MVPKGTVVRTRKTSSNQAVGRPTPILEGEAEENLDVQAVCNNTHVFQVRRRWGFATELKKSAAPQDLGAY